VLSGVATAEEPAGAAVLGGSRQGPAEAGNALGAVAPIPGVMASVTPVPRPLCRTFQTVSSRVWGELQWDHSCGFGLSEHYLTDSVLSDLARSHPTEIQIRKYSAWEEGRTTGADWEWWIGNAGSWLGMRVQAKRIDSHGLTYPKLGYVGGTPRMLQVDRLLADAQAASRIPLYCLYNYWTASTADPAWPCQSYPQRRTFWGCSIAHAQSVAHCINSGTNTLASLRQYIRPWMCLVCCSGFRPSGKAAERTYAYLEHGLPRSGGLDTKLPGVVRNLPAYVVRAVHGEPGVVMPDNLRGIMVITSKPDEPHSQPE